MSDRYSKELDIDIVDSYTTVEWFGISQFEQNQVTFGCASDSYLEDDIPIMAYILCDTIDRSCHMREPLDRIWLLSSICHMGIWFSVGLGWSQHNQLWAGVIMISL
jgi:hypothetical protein